MPTVRALRTYLELPAPEALRPARAVPGAGIERLAPCPVPLYRTLYRDVGGPWRWGERLAWSDAQLAAHLARADVAVFTLRVGDETAGFVELERQPEGAVEIVYFGLLPRFMGRGLGGHFLTLVVQEAWRTGDGVRRVWLHTCTLDAPHALANYQARGFRVTRVEEYDEVVPGASPPPDAPGG